MRAFCLVVLMSVLCLRVVAYATADGADPSYLGNWKLTTAIAAPWADPAHRPGMGERGRLIGKTVRFEDTEIAGPAPFACAGPRYKMRDVTAVMLFQGALADMQPRNDPEVAAAALGFSGPSIKTLETGCAVALLFVDASTAQVGVDGIIYTLKKQ